MLQSIRWFWRWIWNFLDSWDKIFSVYTRTLRENEKTKSCLPPHSTWNRWISLYLHPSTNQVTVHLYLNMSGAWHLWYHDRNIKITHLGYLLCSSEYYSQFTNIFNTFLQRNHWLFYFLFWIFLSILAWDDIMFGNKEMIQSMRLPKGKYAIHSCIRIQCLSCILIG